MHIALPLEVHNEIGIRCDTHSHKLGTPPFKYLIFGEQSLLCCVVYARGTLV